MIKSLFSPVTATVVYYCHFSGKREAHAYAPAESTERIREWVDYYSHQRYHGAIDNVTPADKYYGRDRVILKKREKVRTETLVMRRELNRLAMLETLPNGVS
jgi:hypothetical protein